MEIRTCEEYVLAELDAAQKKLAEMEDVKGEIRMLQEIFCIDEDPTTHELRIGVVEDKLDPTKDAGAAARVLLLQKLFGANKAADSSAPFGGTTLEDLIASGAAVPVAADGKSENGASEDK